MSQPIVQSSLPADRPFDGPIAVPEFGSATDLAERAQTSEPVTTSSADGIITERLDNVGATLSELRGVLEAMSPSVQAIEKRSEGIAHSLGGLSQSQRLAADQVRQMGERLEKVAVAMVDGRFKELLVEILDFKDLLEGMIFTQSPQSSNSGADLLQILASQLDQMLRNQGVTQIEPGDRINYALHLPVKTVEASAENEIGRLIEVLRRGYQLGSSVLRRVEVTVAIGKSSSSNPSETGAS
jgi:molecular chaperone GrpE (heat shock protein)